MIKQTKIKLKKTSKFLCITTFLFYAELFLITINTAYADYELLESESLEGGSLAEYVSSILSFAIGFGAGLAVLVLVAAGVKMIVSPANEKFKSDAKTMIANALWGLAILACSVLLLKTINPDLLSFSF